MKAPWRRAMVAVALLALGGVTAQAETSLTARNVLLVTDGTDISRWAPLIPLLEAAGLRVETVRTWAAAPDIFIDETRRVLNDGPTVLVGEGWSGTAVSAVGANYNVSALVYLAALVPESGENFNALAARFSVKAEVVKRMIAIDPMTTRIDAEALREKPRFYAVTTQDESLPAALQRSYAARLKAKTILLDSLEAHPREIAGLILEAAGMKPAACGAAEDDGTAACAAPALPRSLAEGCRCTKTPLETLTAP
jgi:hypothetical protein